MEKHTLTQTQNSVCVCNTVGFILSVSLSVCLTLSVSLSRSYSMIQYLLDWRAKLRGFKAAAQLLVTN